MRIEPAHRILLIAALAAACPHPGAAFAEVKVIEAETAAVRGGNVSGSDAGRIAVLEAQRSALEQAVAAVSGLARVGDLRLTKDELTAYTAGVLELTTVQEEKRNAGGPPSLSVRIRARIDADVLLKQTERLRDDDELGEQLVASQREGDRLRTKRNALLSRLSGTTDGLTIDRARLHIGRLLAAEESNAEVLRIWSRSAQYAGFPGAPKRAPGPGNGGPDKDIAALVRAVSVVPDNPRAHILLTALYEMKGDAGMAESQLRAAVKANPAMPLFHRELGLFLVRQNRHEEALREFLASERLRPRDPLVLYHIGVVYRHLDQCRQAAVNLKRFLKMAENRSSPRFTAMKSEAGEIIRDCEGKPRGPGSRQRPIRKIE